MKDYKNHSMFYRRLLFAALILAFACNESNDRHDASFAQSFQRVELITKEAGRMVKDDLRGYNHFKATGTMALRDFGVKEFGSDVALEFSKVNRLTYFKIMDKIRLEAQFPADELVNGRAKEADEVYEELSDALFLVSQDLKDHLSYELHAFVDQINQVILDKSERAYTSVQSLDTFMEEGEVYIEDNQLIMQAYSDALVHEVNQVKTQIVVTPGVPTSEKDLLITYCNTLVNSNDDVVAFYDNLYPTESLSTGRTKGFFKKLKHAFKSIVGSVVTVVTTVIGAAAGFISGGPAGAVVGAIVGFTVGVEMGFYFSCEYYPALNSPTNCKECADGGFKGLTCQDCQAVYPSISC